LIFSRVDPVSMPYFLPLIQLSFLIFGAGNVHYPWESWEKRLNVFGKALGGMREKSEKVNRREGLNF